MVQNLLIIPLGYGWSKDLRGNVCADAQGDSRIKAAVDRGINEERYNYEVLYGVIPGIIPPAKGGDGKLNLGDAMTQSFMKYGIPPERIVRGRPHIWGSYAEVCEGLRLGEEMRHGVVFVTSSYHVPRLNLVCAEILGFRAMRHKKLWNMLDVRGCGNEHVSTRDLLTEPVKYTAQSLRIPFGLYMPKTLNGRL